MKKILVLFFTILGILGFFLNSKEDVNAESYPCDPGYYCSAPTGGGFTAWTLISQPGAPKRICQSYNVTFECSGTNSECSGEDCEWRYASQPDCENSTATWICLGCCNKSSCTDTCKDCTPPNCPLGYTSDSSKTTCRDPNTTTTQCDNTGNSCPPSEGCGISERDCYLLETNVTPPMPTSVSIIVDGVKYNLSTNPATPTRIKLPSTASNVQLTEPTITPPSTSGGVGYKFMADNYGVNDEWKGWVSCSGTAGEDFCIESTSNTQNFVPTSKTILQVLKENAKGKISGINYTKDKCDSDKLYSLPIEGYYIVDYIPSENITTDIANDTTAKNCTSSTYTGLDINNPLKFNVTATDTNSNSEIEALIIWFSKDTSVPALVNITGTHTESNTNDFGIMIRKNTGSWNSPLIYSTNTDNTWRILTQQDKLAIQNLTITEGASVTISFSLEFKPTSSNPSGLYNVYGSAIDSYMINNNVVDQSRVKDLFNWGIDLVNPSVDEITQQIIDVSNFFLTWKISESESPLKEVVLNGYRTGGQSSSNIELFAPTTYEDSKGYITAVPIPPESEIGKMGDHDASWEFVDIATYNDLFTAGWFNNNWRYRKPVTISNTTGVARSNEDVLITLDTKDLIDNGRLQADCGDLRFLDNNDTTQLSYWVENGCNSTNTNIWVRIPTFPSAGKTIYMYYSNPAATNGTQIWNGEVTMLADTACPSGWTRNTDFDSRLPYGSSTYGTTGGTSNHTHPQVNPLVSPGYGVTTNGQKVLPLTTVLAPTRHSHTVTITSQSSSNMPPYLTMVFCKKTGLDLTSGLISMFSTANLPSGWTRFSALDGKYPYGGAIYGEAGGSSNHKHTLGGTVSSFSQGVNTTSGTGRASMPSPHTHTISGTTSQASNIPPTWQMVFAKNNGATNSEDIVLMVNSLPPVGWNTYTNLTNRFPSGYTSTQDGGGSTIHSHSFSATLNPSPTIQISTTAGTTSFGIPHSHSASGNFAEQNILPSYRSVIFAERKTSENVNIGAELRKGETWPLVGVTNLGNVTSKINIGENEGGAINMYVTAYDQACNSNSNFENIDLNPWITAKGGAIYSNSGITNSAKDVTGLSELDGMFENLTTTELDTGTEVISARNDILPELLHPELKAVRALNIYDSNDRKSYWFDHFKEKLAKEKVSNAIQIATPTSPCTSGICYVYSTEDIVLNTGFSCTSKILVMSEGNITINPDITSSSTNTGCIFLAKKNIYIGAGTYKTGENTNIHYDYLDAYLMAQGQIIFNLVDTDKSLRDGIEINGGMVAFGNGVTSASAINVLRNLKLLNISNPTVVTNYDYKYPNIATQFFGVEAPIYKQEIGFKSF